MAKIVFFLIGANTVHNERTSNSFLAELKSIMGDQKIGVVFDNANTRLKTRFYHSITRRNIEL